VLEQVGRMLQEVAKVLILPGMDTCTHLTLIFSVTEKEQFDALLRYQCNTDSVGVGVVRAAIHHLAKVAHGLQRPATLTFRQKFDDDVEHQASSDMNATYV
jgi:hypothetical protein